MLGKAAEEKGVSLTEVLIGLSLMLLVLQGTYLFYVYGNQSWSRTTETITARREAKSAIDEISADVRGARAASETSPAIERAARDEVVFFADIDDDGQPERVRYYRVGDRVFKATQEPQTTQAPWLFLDGDETLSVLAKQAAGVDEPLFRYFSAPGAELTALPLASADRAEVKLVKVSLAVDVDPNEPPAPLALETDIHLRNAR